MEEEEGEGGRMVIGKAFIPRTDPKRPTLQFMSGTQTENVERNGASGDTSLTEDFGMLVVAMVTVAVEDGMLVAEVIVAML